MPNFAAVVNLRKKNFAKFCDHPGVQGWAKLVLIALERYSVALKRLTFNLR
jgi:hypothetical protein